MKLLIIGSPQSHESQLLKKEAEKKDHSAEIIPLSKLIFAGQNKLLITTLKDLDIECFDAVLFRAINRHITEAKIIAQYMNDRKKIVIDKVLANDNYYFHKFFMHHRLWLKNIPQPVTYYAFDLEGIQTVIQKLKPPVIVKHIKGMHGRSIFRFDTQQAVLDFFKTPRTKRLGSYIIQEWYPCEYYYRTLVLNNKVLGAMERVSLFNQNQSKIPLSQRSKKAEPFTALKELSLKTARALKIELAGLDIMPDRDGVLRVLEINRSPKFERFTQITGINVSEKIIKYLEQKIR